MLQRLQTMWRNWRERRREYQIERALYKAGEEGTSPEDATRHVGGGGTASGGL